MNLSKYKDKTFPARKTAKELGIDTSRKFVVVEGNEVFDEGDILVLEEDDNTIRPNFKRVSDSETSFLTLSYLAYLEEEEEYVPRAGDKVRLEGEIVIDQCGTWIKCPLRNNGEHNSWLIQDIPASLTLISRAPRTLTKAEATKLLEEHLNESITIL